MQLTYRAAEVNIHTAEAEPSRQVQALESFFEEFEQAVAKAGSAVVAVTTAVVYDWQKVMAAPAEAVKAAAQASVSGFAHPKAKGAAKAPRRRYLLTILDKVWLGGGRVTEEDLKGRNLSRYRNLSIRRRIA